LVFLGPASRPAQAPVAGGGRRLTRLGVGLLVLGSILVAAASLDLQLRHYWLDDPYISFRYAWNLVHGNGLTYNAGQHVEGFSNPSWTLLSAAALTLGWDPLVTSRIAGLGLHLAAIVAVWAGVRDRRTPTARPSGLLPTVRSLVPRVLAGALLATSSWTGLWALAGLETPLFAFALVAAVVAYQFDRRSAAAALMLLAALTRVEGVGFGLAFVVVLLRERGLSREVRRPLLILVLPFVAVLLARVGYYGHVLPNSYTDKTGLSMAANLRSGTLYLVGSVQRALRLPVSGGVQDRMVWLAVALLGIAALALLLALVRVQTAPGGARWLGAASIWLIVAITVGGGGDWMPAARFLVPALPLVALWLGWTMTWVLRPGRGRPAWVRTPAAAVSVLVGAAAVLLVAQGQQQNVASALARYQPSGTPNADRNPNYVSLARWLRGHTRWGDLVALEEAGLIPYETPELRYLDLFGLNDATIARAPGKPPFDKHDNSYVLAARPRYMVIWGVPDTGQGFRWSHQLSLVTDPRFAAAYRFVASAPKDVRYSFRIYERSSA